MGGKELGAIRGTGEKMRSVHECREGQWLVVSCQWGASGRVAGSFIHRVNKLNNGWVARIAASVWGQRVYGPNRRRKKKWGRE